MEREIVKQLKKFKTVKPSKEWLFATKEEILRNHPAIEKTGFHWLLWQKSAVLAGSCLAVLLVFFATIGVKNLGPLSEWTGQLVSVGDPSSEVLLVSLRSLENNLNQTAATLKNIKDPKQILGFQDSLNATIQQGESLVERTKKENLAKKLSKPQEALSALSGIESALTSLKETNQAMQKSAAEREIAEMKNRILTDEQQALLKEADDSFMAGDYPQALAKIAEIGN